MRIFKKTHSKLLKIIILFLILSLLPNTSFKVSADGETYYNAIVIRLGYTSGIMPGPGSSGEIWYRITLNYPTPNFFGSDDGHFRFILTPTGGDFDLYVYQYDGTTLLDSSQRGGTDVDIAEFYRQNPYSFGQGGPYIEDFLIKVVPWGGSTGEFTLMIDDFIGVVGDSAGHAILTGLGNTTGGLPGPASDGSRWYVTTLTKMAYNISILTAPEGSDYDFTLYNSNLNSIDSTTGSSYPKTLSFTDLPPGDYGIRMFASSGTGAYTLNILQGDIDPPTVEITSPMSTIYNQNEVTLSYSVSDGAVSIYIDDVKNTTALPSGTVLTNLADGEHNITIASIDQAGNIGIETVFFSVDTTPPDIDIITPITKIYTETGVILSYTISDGVSTIYIDDVANTTAIPSGSSITDLIEGSHNITIVAVDTMGNIGKETTIFTIDTIAPLLIIDSPFSPSYSISSVSISFSGESEFYWYFVEGIDGQNLSWTAISQRSFVDGIYTLKAYGNDSAGNIGYAWTTFTIDTVAPTINHPTDGTYEEGTAIYNLSWSPSDINPAYFYLFEDGIIKSEGNWNGSDLMMDVGGLPFGTHIFEFIAIDINGLNVSDTVIISVVDGIQPTIDSPEDILYNHGQMNLFLTWNPSDSNPRFFFIHKNDLVVDGGLWNGESLSIDVSNLKCGVYTYICFVYDEPGNQANDSVTVTVVDDIAPSIDHPSDLVYVEGAKMNNITWTPSDTNPKGFLIERDGEFLIEGPWNGAPITISVDGLPSGTYSYTCTVYDQSGGLVIDNVVVVITKAPDNIAPTIDHPNDIVHIEEIMGNNLNWNPIDANPSRYEITRNDTLIQSGEWDGRCITISLDGLTPGNYTYECTVFDEASNSVSDSVLVHVPETPSSASWPSLFLSIFAVGIALIWKKRKRN